MAGALLLLVNGNKGALVPFTERSHAVHAYVALHANRAFACELPWAFDGTASELMDLKLSGWAQESVSLDHSGHTGCA